MKEIEQKQIDLLNACKKALLDCEDLEKRKKLWLDFCEKNVSAVDGNFHLNIFLFFKTAQDLYECYKEAEFHCFVIGYGICLLHQDKFFEQFIVNLIMFVYYPAEYADVILF